MQFPTPGVVRTIVENEHIHIIQYASHTKFLNHPGSGANLLPEYDTTFVNTVFSKWISCLEISHFRRSSILMQISFRTLPLTTVGGAAIGKHKTSMVGGGYYTLESSWPQHQFEKFSHAIIPLTMALRKRDAKICKGKRLQCAPVRVHVLLCTFLTEVGGGGGSKPDPQLAACHACHTIYLLPAQ